MDENNSNNVIYFLLGLTVGATAALLLAPQSGRETRGLIKNRLGDGGEYLKRRTDDLRDSAGEFVDRGKTVVARQREQFAAAVEAGRRAYRETVQPQGQSSDLEELGI